MQANLSDLSLREASSADAEFIYELVEATMREHVEKIWGSFDEDNNRRHVVDAIANRSYSVVALCGQDVGAIALEREDTHIQLAQLYIAPSHQNRGIGTHLLHQLIEEAKISRKPLRLRVLATNPARRLYERHGFRVVSRTPERFFLELHV